MFCNNCGKEIKDINNKFCGHCGEKLNINTDQELEKITENSKSDVFNEYGIKLYNGDTSSFEKIYENSYKWVRAYVFNRIPSTEVDDCMQNIYVKVYEKISLFDSSKSNFRAWFNTLMKNETTDYIRKFSSKTGKDEYIFVGEDGEDLDLGMESGFAYPEVEIDKQETQRLIREILDTLPEEQRICLSLFYIENMKQSEIAKELGLSEGTVKSRLYYGKQQVKDKVLDLEKRGTKLYSMAPIPFFLWLMSQCTQEVSASTGLWNSIQSGISASVGTIEASATVTTSTVTASATTTGTALSSATTVASKGMLVKSIACIVAVAVMGVGGYYIYNTIDTNGNNSTVINNSVENHEGKIEINPFDYIKVTYSGISEEAELKLEIMFENDALNELYPSIVDQDGWGRTQKIKNGDIITISYEKYAEKIDELGYFFTEYEKEYKVSDLDEYLKDVNNISPEDLEKMKKEATNTLREKYGDLKYLTLGEIKYEGAWVQNEKNRDAGFMQTDRLFIILSANVDARDTSGKIFFPMLIDKVIINSEGKCEYNSEDISIYGVNLFYHSHRFIYGFETGESMYDWIVNDNCDHTMTDGIKKYEN